MAIALDSRYEMCGKFVLLFFLSKKKLNRNVKNPYGKVKKKLKNFGPKKKLKCVEIINDFNISQNRNI